MKPVLLVAALVMAAPLAFGAETQATPEGFLAMVPAVPVVTGIATDMARSAFHDKVAAVIDNMDAILKQIPDSGAKKGGFFSRFIPGPLRSVASKVPDPADAIRDTPTRKNLAKTKAKFAELDAEYKKSREEISVDEVNTKRKANRMDSKTATKRYAALLKEYQAAIKAALPDFQKEAALSVATAAPGASKVAAVSGPAMREIREYAQRVLDMYKYVIDND